jgi:hypothetical protein
MNEMYLFYFKKILYNIIQKNKWKIYIKKEKIDNQNKLYFYI